MGINFRTTCAAALWQSYYSARLRYFTAAEWQTRVVMDIFGCFAETVRKAAREGEWRHARVQVFQTQALERSAMGSGNRLATPSRPEEFHLEPLTEPYVKLSLHTARVIHEGCRLPPLCWVHPDFSVDPKRRR
jgi:hypothetical protein